MNKGKLAKHNSIKKLFHQPFIKQGKIKELYVN
jgi:hypothetical protein